MERITELRHTLRLLQLYSTNMAVEVRYPLPCCFWDFSLRPVSFMCVCVYVVCVCVCVCLTREVRQAREAPARVGSECRRSSLPIPPFLVFPTSVSLFLSKGVCCRVHGFCTLIGFALTMGMYRLAVLGWQAIVEPAHLRGDLGALLQAMAEPSNQSPSHKISLFLASQHLSWGPHDNSALHHSRWCLFCVKKVLSTVPIERHDSG